MTGLPALRHLDYGPHATLGDLGRAGLQAIVDGGDVQAWRPLLAEVQRDPWGTVATRLERVLDNLETYGTGPALAAWLGACRAGSDQPAWELAELRRQAGLSQRQLGERLGISQAQVARVETAAAPSMRSLARYLGGLGMAPVALVVTDPNGAKVVRLHSALQRRHAGPIR